MKTFSKFIYFWKHYAQWLNFIIILVTNKVFKTFFRYEYLIYSILQHQCQKRAAPVWNERHESNTSSTWATRVQHKCDTSNTSATWVLREKHECDTSENFDFANDASENICISYMYLY